LILEEVIDEIEGFLKEVLTLFDLKNPQISYDVTESPLPEFGDYSTNISFQLAKVLHKSPLSIAEEIVRRKLELCSKWTNRHYIENARYEKPGFINFVLNRQVFLGHFLQNDNIKDITSTSRFFNQNNKDTIILEHTSVNPNKALHVGHLRNAIIGDCLYRIFKKTGYKVKVLNYVDDSGLQVADIIVGFKHAGIPTEESKSNQTEYFKFDQYCGNEVYVKVNELYKNRPDLLEKRTKIMKELENPNSETSIFTKSIVNKVLIEQLKTTWNFKIHYDLLNFESQIVQSSLWYQLFEILKEKEIIKYEVEGKNNGCWIYRSATEGDKILIRSDSTLTYFAKDIPFAVWKLGFLKNPFLFSFFATQWDSTELYSTTLQEEINANVEENRNDRNNFTIDFDKISRVITIIDSRQERLQNLIIEILIKLGIPASKYEYLGYEPVILSKNTIAMLGIETENSRAAHMSGRKGIFVEADLALESLEQKAMLETRKRNPEIREDEMRNISKEIAISAIRYYFIKYDFGKMITFDFNDSLSLDGDTAPYIQYAYARGKKIEEKLRETNHQRSYKELLPDKSTIESSGAEMALIKHLCRYTMELNHSSQNANPKIMAKYLYQLATLFNNFYESSPILSESNTNLAHSRTIIMKKCLIVFEECMEIIGISPLRRM
jgi:arginyl-tRNA synthetase